MDYNCLARACRIGLVVAVLISCAAQSRANDFFAAIENGKPSISLRLSYEYSSLDDGSLTLPNPAAGRKHRAPANGLTLQTRLGYTTGEFYDTNAFVQVQNVSNLVEDFATGPTAPRGSRRDFIPDPDGNRVHQAYIDFEGIPNTRLRLGRQEIALDDFRLIGHSFWRQNGQSYDGVSLLNRSMPAFELFSAVLSDVNTPGLNQNVDSERLIGKSYELDHLILANASVTLAETHHITGFSYWLDTENRLPSARDSVTFGARLNGSYREVVDYDMTYAKQEDYKDGRDHKGDLVHVFVGTAVNVVNFGVGYSQISGQDGATAADGRAFDTLFSRAHKWNGWSDQFTGTNGGGLPAGLEEWYFQIGTQLAGTDILFRYHLFDTTNERTQYGGTYGDEFDFNFSRKLTDNLSAQLQMAFYNEAHREQSGRDNPTADEDVIIGRLMYSF